MSTKEVERKARMAVVEGFGARIRCKECGDSIQSTNYSGEFVTCSCGKTSVDGTEHYTRMLGDCWEYDSTDRGSGGRNDPYHS